MARHVHFWIIVISWITLVPLSLCQISPTPADATGTVGQEVMMECGYTGPYSLEWVEYITSPVGTQIFLTPPDSQPENSFKYRVEGSFNLVVQNLEFTDGGIYGCKSADMGTYQEARLVVLEEPTFLISNTLVEGKISQFTCLADYGGPFEAGDSHTPKMALDMDGDPVEVTVEYTYPEPAPPEDYVVGRISAMFNYTGRREDTDKNLTCKVYTEQPAFSLWTTTKLYIRYPPENMQFHPHKEDYYIQEQINCSADGYPPPEFRWTPVMSPGPRIVDGPTLLITPEMVGSNEWTCYAENTVENKEIIERTIVFTVHSLTTELPTEPPYTMVELTMELPIQPSVVAFEAAKYTDQTLQDDAFILFEETKLNVGNGYNSITGKFTTPMAGIYSVHLHMCSVGFMWYHLRVNGLLVAGLDNMEYTDSLVQDVHQIDNYVGRVLYLNTGDVIDVLGCGQTNTGCSGETKCAYDQCSFGGFLISTIS